MGPIEWSNTIEQSQEETDRIVEQRTEAEDTPVEDKPYMSRDMALADTCRW